MLTLLTSLCVIGGVAAQLPPGVYSTADLCRRLAKTEGPVSVSPDLQDYPLYLSLHSPTPKRIETLMAAALKGQWVGRANTLQLVPAKPSRTEDFVEFERQLKIAFKGKPYEGLPARDLHDMPRGSLIRFGTKPTNLLHGLPGEMLSQDEHPQIWRVRRMLYGIFELSGDGPKGTVDPFGAGGQVQFDSLPPSVETFLGNDLQRAVPPNPEFPKVMGSLGERMAASPGEDPTALLVGTALKGLGEAVEKDLAIAIPDGTIMPIAMNAETPNGETVGARLASLSSVVNWTEFDGALVGALPPAESFDRSQARRDLLRSTLQEFAGAKFIDMGKLAEYVGGQRPQASDTWMDAMLLSICHVGVEEEFIADYPYNARLYSELNDRDWSLLKSGRPFRASELGGTAQTALQTLLVQSRADEERQKPDPALWPSLAPADLVLSASYEHKPIFVLWEAGGTRVGDAHDVAFEFTRLILQGKPEPTFQAGDLQKLTIKVASLSGESMKTGFSNVVIPQGQKAVAWRNLPQDLAAQLKKAFDDNAQQGAQPRSGTPPP